MFSAGQQIGSYILINRIGRGGFGEVWLAERKSKFVTTKVAVKLPLDQQVDHETIKQEAQLWEKASGHPNILPIIDADVYDGQVAIVSEYVEGGSLDDKLKAQGKIPVNEAVETAIGILRGLEYLHSKNILHRDIKPQNILLQGNTPRLSDFGISRLIETSSVSSTIIGTGAYMSPESFEGVRSVQTDIWSVGVVLYQLLKGNLPFSQEQPTEVMFAILMKEPEPLPDEVPPRLREIVFKALEKDRELGQNPPRRYQSTTQMRVDLHNFLAGFSFPQVSPIENESKTISQGNLPSSTVTESETMLNEVETKVAVNKTPSNQSVAAEFLSQQNSDATKLKDILPAKMGKEAKARVIIDMLLNEAGWRFFDNEKGAANVLIEQNVKITQVILDELGENFEKTKNGYTDYSLIGEDGRVVAVLEAKAQHLNPLVGKEQARAYAYSQNARFVILSNGNQHYLWDTWLGNPRVITKFPRLEELADFENFQPTAANVTRIEIKDDFIVQTQKPDYASDPRFRAEGDERRAFIEENKLRFLRPYQVKAMHAVQRQIKDGKDRFLFEMATGTGKTLTSAAVIKMFLKSSNVKRVLFLVDRLELEDQAAKAFKQYLKNDFRTVVYKENRTDWRDAEIVVSTVQSLLFKNKYKRHFKSDDFQLIISDEAHRSIGGNSRAVFEYFIGYKLGLTATPKNYLKKIDALSLNAKDPRELERRLLLDTYSIFGCESGDPTFSYSLADGVKDGFLVNPFVLDARTEITTQLLSDEGFSVLVGMQAETETPIDELKNADEAAQANAIIAEQKETFFSRDFERKFFSENTNRAFCRTFLENALRDPITGETGKTIIFAVSQNHAAKIAQLLNEEADKMFPGKYHSDFALQVTSLIKDSQQMTINFTNNNLRGRSEFDPLYPTSKTRVCVTVGMMTTGYDCPDLLNVCLMRPIFSPSDFVQIKGRGTRKHNFTSDVRDRDRAREIGRKDKTVFRLFDFFANCEYFEEKFDYDAKLELPVEKQKGENGEGDPGDLGINIDEFDSKLADELKTLKETEVSTDGMKVDRKLFERFEDRVKSDSEIRRMVEGRDFGAVEDYIATNIFDKPNEYYNLDKLRKTLKIDRRLSLSEIVGKIFGVVPYFKSKNELLEDEFDKFDSRYPVAEAEFSAAKGFLKAYLTDAEFREIVESRQFARLATNPNGAVFRKVPIELRNQIIGYVKDNISLNQFME